MSPSWPVRIQQLLAVREAVSVSGDRKVLSRKLARLERGVTTTDVKVDTPLDPSGDLSLIQQYQEQLFDYKKDLTDVHEGLLALDLDEGDELLTFHARLETLILI